MSSSRRRPLWFWLDYAGVRSTATSRHLAALRAVDRAVFLAHMRRWVRRGVIGSHFVEWHGAPVSSVKTAFRRAVALAGLWGKVTPHTLRHTAATWLMQRGVPIWQAAGYLGMSAQILEQTYGHHHPD
jgi:integrase